MMREGDGEELGAPARQGGVRIQSVSRAVRLLLLAAGGTTDGTCKALAARAGLAVPTAHHLLSTLVDEGLLTRDGRARYSLGPKMALLADAYQRGLAVPEYLLAPLDQLAATMAETTYLAAWRGSEIRVLGVVEGNLAVRVSAIPITGVYRDAHARAGGKVLLAWAPDRRRERYLTANPLRRLTPRTIVDEDEFARELDWIRTNGYAVDEEGFLSGVSCVSVPVLHDGVLIAAYSVSLPASRFSERRAEFITALLGVARSVEGAIELAGTRPIAGTARKPVDPDGRSSRAGPGRNSAGDPDATRLPQMSRTSSRCSRRIERSAESGSIQADATR